MRTVYYYLLLFGVTLPWIAGLNLEEIIKTAQCQSACLRNLTTDDKCWNVGKNENRQCEKCWQTCEFLGPFYNEQRIDFCNKRLFLNCSSCEIACTFYRTHGIEEDQYEPIKLPAPEEGEIVMNKHDMAVTMHKNLEGTWEMQKQYTANEKVIMKPGKWIIITNENGAIKHYSWEKWLPKLQSIKKNGPLYQANITWTDWQEQLEQQRDEISLPGDKIFLELRSRKKKKTKPLYIVTWQEETGNGIMGNQVADSESAQISLLPGRYLIRIAINDGPGSFSIVIDTDNTITEFFTWQHIMFECHISAILLSFGLIIPLLLLIIKLIIKLRRQKIKREMENDIEMVCPPETEMRPNKKNSTLILHFKHESNRTDSDCSTDCYTDNTNEYNELWMETDINANANMQNANVQNVNVNVQDANVNIQDVTANTQNATTNAIQRT